MRWIVLVLVLLNGGLFAWQYYGGQGKQMAGQTSEGKGEYDPLTLISELSPEQRQVLGVTSKDGSTKGAGEMPKQESGKAAGEEKGAAKTEEMPKPAEKMAAETKPPAEKKAAKVAPQPEPKHAAQSYCYSLGPLNNKKLLNRVKGRVTSMGMVVDGIRNEVEQVPTNWIYLGPYKTETEAKRVVQRLHSKGIKDTQMINKGARNIVISVGLFSTKAGADDRLKHLQDAGFTPNVSQVTAKKSHYWLDVSYQGGKQVDTKILQDMVRGVSGASVKEKECKVH